MPSASMLRDVTVVHGLLMNLGNATAFFEQGEVHDCGEYYEAACQLFDIKPSADVYHEVLTINNAVAFAAEFIRGHKRDLINMGWIDG